MSASVGSASAGCSQLQRVRFPSRKTRHRARRLLTPRTPWQRSPSASASPPSPPSPSPSLLLSASVSGSRRLLRNCCSTLMATSAHKPSFNFKIWDSSSSFKKLHEVLPRCFLSYNWSESSCTPAYINCRPVLRSHWLKLSRAETEPSDWSSAGVVVWNYYGIPLHRGTAA